MTARKLFKYIDDVLHGYLPDFLLECLSDKQKSKISKKELNDELLVVIGKLEAYRHALELVEALQK
jgi:hypothetical protein